MSSFSVYSGRSKANDPAPEKSNEREMMSSKR